MIDLSIKYGIIFLIFSIFGYLGELIAYPIIKKCVIRRGSPYGPYCPIYGFGSILMIFLIKLGITNLFAYVIVATIVLTTLEYIGGYLFEKIFHTKCWDYSFYKYNLHGRIALQFSIAFGLAALLFKLFAYSYIDKFINSELSRTIICISLIIFGLFIFDLILSGIKYLKIRNRIGENL